MHGFLLIDKPVGPSSNAAVQHVRRTLGMGGRKGTKAGHAGTLDPFASGLLVVLVGRATRLMPYVVGHDKRYLVDVRFGASSDTDDSTGVLEPSSAPVPTRAAVEAAVAQVQASTEQVPPAVSALHIDGVRAYTRVRRGEVVAVPPRPVRIEAIDIVSWEPDADGGPHLRIDVRCGTGTYMRAIARDLGALVGCPAHCDGLRRESVGEWNVGDAVGPEEVRRSDVRDSSQLVGDAPVIEVGAGELEEIASGRRIPVPAGRSDLAGLTVALIGPDGQLVSMGEVDAAGNLLQPRTVLIDPVVVQGSRT